MVTAAKQSNLDSLIADLEQEENVEFQLKQEHSEESGQILEVYEISNIEDADIAYEEAEENEDLSEEQYELMNVIADSKEDDTAYEPLAGRSKKMKIEHDFSEIKQRTPTKNVDEETMGKAIKEIISNTSRYLV